MDPKRVEDLVFFFGYINFRVRGWCPSPRQGRPSGSKSTYKGLKFPRQLNVEVFLDSLLPKFSLVVNCSRFHNSAVNCRGTFE
ncbi:hypothetical protein MTR_7g095490 [Medicago truncatula]|uniref:Uncharacterized protein n=1 Tax=Medicago truncatula TaxID=3880 RepID=A0A072U3T8_MEDTR|nr:hypothetical protein MTR_7g095490 [Medicago truncatula]